MQCTKILIDSKIVLPLSCTVAIQSIDRLVHPKPKFGCHDFEGPDVFELDIAAKTIIFRQNEIVTKLQAILQVKLELELKTKTV